MQESRLWGYSDHKRTIYSIRLYHFLPFSMQKRPKMALFGQKLIFSA